VGGNGVDDGCGWVFDLVDVCVRSALYNAAPITVLASDERSHPVDGAL
jgi:hypothetical protein